MVTLGMALFAAQFAWVIYNSYVQLFLQASSPEFDALKKWLIIIDEYTLDQLPKTRPAG